MRNWSALCGSWRRRGGRAPAALAAAPAATARATASAASATAAVADDHVGRAFGELALTARSASSGPSDESPPAR
jgi:hypothetical protein